MQTKKNNQVLTERLVKSRINKFLKGRNNISCRYSSFDLCYLYFKKNKGCLTGKKLQQSCLQLWAFLGSWGMITRGNALQKLSYASLKELITLINNNPQYYKVDINNKDYVATVLCLYYQIKQILKLNQKSQKTLITKIILGVYGICPAFDSYFCECFKSSTLGDLTKNDLDKVVSFYSNNRNIIDNCRKNINVLNFDGSKSNLLYTEAKLIDMIGFTR